MYDSGPVEVGTSDTDIYEMSATLEGVVGLAVGNVNGSARTVTLKYYNQQLDTTTTIVSGKSIAANDFVRWPGSFSMKAGDKIIMSANAADSIRVVPTVVTTEAAPAKKGFTPRGEWSDAVTYARNDLVRVEDAIATGQGATYISLQDSNTNQDPTTESAYWMIYVADGAQGAPGDFGEDDIASDSEVRSAAAGNNLLKAAHIESASADVALTDAAPVAVDWDAGINFTLTVTANRAIGNPTNGQPGTYRSILVQGNDGTDRTITFGNQYLGDVPTITDCDSGKWYLLTIRCITSSHFVATAVVAKKP